MTALLERERELADLDAMVGEARAGAGQLVAIEAHAGLGKTRLLQVAREAGADTGLHVLSARATELERDFPFALVRQLFEPSLTELSDPERDALFEGAEAARGALGLADGSSSAERPRDTFSVLHGLYWLTAALAERQPLLLTIDDAQWSDAASLDYLGFLLPRLAELPVLVIVACRPTAADTTGSLAQIVTDTSARRLTPRALSREAATQLLAGELGRPPDAEFVATCHEVSGGNPFFLYELARTLVAQEIHPGANQAQLVRELAPERVARTVLLRISRLSHAAGAVARALAVAGDDSDPRLVAELAGLDLNATLAAGDALRTTAILDSGAPLRFIHPLVRTAVYSELPAGERGAAHAHAAALLRAGGARPEQIATHLVATEAEGKRETVAVLLEAATRALASGAPRSAIAYLTRALREPAPPDLRPAVLDPLITASMRATDHSALATIESDVFAELERNPSLLSRWAIRLTGWMALSGRFDQAVPLLERAIEVAAAEDDYERAFRLEAQLSTVALLPPAVARERLERYNGHIQPDSPSGRLAAALQARWTVLSGSASEAVELGRRALVENGKIFTEQPELVGPGGAVLVLILADELDEAQRAAERAFAIARQRNATPELAGAWWLNGAVAWARGDLVAAEADIRQAVHLARLGGLLPAALLLTAPLIEVLIERGEVQAAEAELEAHGMSTGPVPPLPMLGLLLYGRGRLHLARGRMREAADDFSEFQRRAVPWGISEGPMLLVDAYAARAQLSLGEPALARELAEAALTRARRWGAPSMISRTLRPLGLTIGGADGLKLLEEAVHVLEGSPARLQRAHALSELGAALRRENRRAEAREPLREALELARRCGAVGLAKSAHDELAATGERVRRYTPIGVESLTPSERRVAELAASGLTNRQIAQTLFLTVKTIESHLSASYDKLDIRSRRELAAALRD